MKKKILPLIVLLIAAYFGYNYVMAAPDDISKKTADFTLNATNLTTEFLKDEKAASSKYQEKVIIVSGKITEIENNSITIDNKVTCSFNEKPQLQKDQIVKIKGIFIGFDDMFELVKLDRSSIVN